MNAQDTPELKAIQAALAFNAELTAASHKSVIAGHAMIKSDMYLCPVEDIKILPDFNPRIQDDAYRAHIRGLADSIAANGFFLDKPLAGFGAIEGKKAVIYVTDGHCRLAAVKLAIDEGAPISEVPLVLCDKSTTMEDLTIQLVRANEGKRFSPMELAVVCKRLSSFGWKPVKISEKLSMTPEYVNQLLTLAGAPNAIREMVQQGEATAAVALGALRAHGEKAGEVLGEALKVAKATGKAKVTNKFMPEQVYKAALTKSAPKMYQALERIQTNEAYASLPDDLQALIAELVATIKKSSIPENGETVTTGSGTDASSAKATGTASAASSIGA
jgi:ParB family chromosome partitioning protein